MLIKLMIYSSKEVQIVELALVVQLISPETDEIIRPQIASSGSNVYVAGLMEVKIIKKYSSKSRYRQWSWL